MKRRRLTRKVRPRTLRRKHTRRLDSDLGEIEDDEWDEMDFGGDYDQKDGKSG